MLLLPIKRFWLNMRWNLLSFRRKTPFLHFKAAVAGGISVIKAMEGSLSSNHMSGIYCILNETCNYILTRIFTEGLSFKDCLADA